jgi:hypothetical protein
MPRTAWLGLLGWILPLTVQAAPATIDLLPAERANIVDLQGDAPIRVAVLGSPGLNVASIVPESLVLSGASVDEFVDGPLTAAVNDEAKASLEEITRHRPAHDAEADEAYGIGHEPER